MAATPVAFDGLFGWLHPAAGGRGVVLCGAHGFEQVAAHRPWGALAAALAAAGCPTLRFDYPGEGDSGDPDAAGIVACRAAIHAAVRFLRATTGVTEVVLVGLRLGASLAASAAREMAARDLPGPERLVLLAPPVTGRAYLREMRLRARTVGRLPDGSPGPQEPDCLTVGGFRMGAAFLAEVADLDLARAGTGGADRARPDRTLLLAPDASALAGRVTDLGTVEIGPLPGLAQLVGDPIFSETPTGDFARIAAFVTEGAPDRAPTAARPTPSPARIDGPGWREAPTRFGPSQAGIGQVGGGLFGIVCTPALPAPGAPTVVFVSTGMTARSGWGRQSTELARTLAGEGVGSLRFDLAGVGDSADRADGHRPLFAADGFEDIRLALDHLAERDGPVVLVGGCSGAYAAFHALTRDARIDGALLVNLYCFDWDPARDIDDVIRQTFGSASSYAARLKHAGTWRRLLRGQIRVGAIGAVLARRAVAAASRRVRRLFRPGPPGGSVARRVAALRRRGAALRLLYSAGDPGLIALRRHLGPSLERAERRLGAAVSIVPATDHNLGSPDAQADLARHLRDLLGAVRRAPAVRAGAREAGGRFALPVAPAMAGPDRA